MDLRERIKDEFLEKSNHENMIPWGTALAIVFKVLGEPRRAYSFDDEPKRPWFEDSEYSDLKTNHDTKMKAYVVCVEPIEEKCDHKIAMRVASQLVNCPDGEDLKFCPKCGDKLGGADDS